MKALVIVLLGASAAAFAQAADVPQTLFDAAMQSEEQGQYKRAMVTLETLAGTYPESPQAARAKTEIDALKLFQDGLDRMHAGQNGMAFVTFRTLAQVYPESPLAKQAEVVSRVVDPDASAPIVVGVQLRGLWPVSRREVLERFAESEIALAAGRPYDAAQVERARKALAQLVAERGRGNVEIREDAQFSLAGAVLVDFTLEPVAPRRSGGLPVLGSVGRSVAAVKRAVLFQRKEPSN